jgi:6-phosphogluconolactonase
MTTLRTQRFASRNELNAALAERLEEALSSAGGRGSPTAIMLSGGTTPLAAYRDVAQRISSGAGPAPSPDLRVLFSDDRYVPATSSSSNYHQCKPLLDALALPESSILRVRTELPLEEAAQDYERQLRELLRSGVRVTLGLLGLGADGHTASLFSPDHLERARGRLAIAVQRPDGMAGISVTPEFLSQVAEPIFVVAGGGKYDAIHGLLKQDPNVVAWRAVQGCPDVQVWLEQAALSAVIA